MIVLLGIFNVRLFVLYFINLEIGCCGVKFFFVFVLFLIKVNRFIGVLFLNYLKLIKILKCWKWG